MRARRPEVFPRAIKTGKRGKIVLLERGRKRKREKRSGHILAAQVTFRVRATRSNGTLEFGRLSEMLAEKTAREERKRVRERQR